MYIAIGVLLIGSLLVSFIGGIWLFIRLALSMSSLDTIENDDDQEGETDQ